MEGEECPFFFLPSTLHDLSVVSFQVIRLDLPVQG